MREVNSQVSTFLDRLRRVIGKRQPYSWAASLGWSKGTTARVMEGHIPGPEHLVGICQAENASLDWLLTGRGRPYRVAVFMEDIPAGDYFMQLVEDEAWRIHLLYPESGPRVIVLTLPGQVMAKSGRMIDVTLTEVIACPAPGRIVANIHEMMDRPVHRLKFDPHDIARLITGQMGSIELLEKMMAHPGYSAALEGERVHEGAAEAQAEYAKQEEIESTELSADDQILLDRFRHLTPEDRELLGAMAEKLGRAG